jgi:glutamine synthetase
MLRNDLVHVAVVSRFGIEQEFTLLQKDVHWPLGWPIGGYPGAQVHGSFN